MAEIIQIFFCLSLFSFWSMATFPKFKAVISRIEYVLELGVGGKASPLIAESKFCNYN